MNTKLQITLFCLMAVSMVYARPSYLGYPYAAAVHPYAAVPYGLPAPVHDTPEVAAAKAAHFAAYNAAASAAAASPDPGHYAGAYAGPYAGHYSAPHGHYVGPLAGVPVLVNGVPADTPEVAHAKAAHFAAHAAAAHGAHYG